MRVELTRCYRFPAAHVLCQPSLGPEENERIFGKCANPAGHGHNYGIEVTVTGPLDENGWVADPDALDAVFDEVVRGPFSYRMLNELDAFAELVPTAENLARVVHRDLAPALAERTGARLARVRVVETARNSFEVGEPR